ncbi:unnamed protein product [Owenia fusiformis]|uniref:Chitin-binding type-2 domain-containing protein n=1 Tax=Owenia fusiformis TaxID=6347 RepID=A0A8S4Q616_OWEFU|nr:unnamed protein product [Owenia fusiformis]
MTTFRSLFTILIGFTAINAVVSQCDCINSGPDETICEWACTYFIYCQNNNEIRIDCPVGEVVNVDNGTCDTVENVPPPCGVLRNCTGKADGYYANTDDNCLSYHYCEGEQFMSNNICNDGLVFDEAQQICNWPANVCPPCGDGSGDVIEPCTRTS